MKPLLKTGQHTPIWFMRQAGRYLPEYIELRKNFPSFMDFCLTPEAAIEATLQPLRRFDLDGAIIFSDIMVASEVLGLHVEFLEGVGPVLKTPLNSHEEILRLTSEKNYNYEVLDKLASTVSGLKAKLKVLHPKAAIIGFVGAPWTIACYMIGQGARAKKGFPDIMRMLFSHPAALFKLLALIEDITFEMLKVQIEAGAEVVKIFESWARIIPADFFEDIAIASLSRLVSRVKATFDVKIMWFPKLNYVPTEWIDKTGVDSITLDSTVNLKLAAAMQKKVRVQYCLDSYATTIPLNEIRYALGEMIHRIKDALAPGFIFSSTALPETNIATLQYIIDLVRQ